MRLAFDKAQVQSRSTSRTEVHMSLVTRKSVSGVSEQIRHKSARTAIEDGKMLIIITIITSIF